MKYSSGYKHQVRETFSVQLMYIHTSTEIDTWYCKLSVSGMLTVKRGFAWDGASGPTWDTKATMTPACVHDCLAKLIRTGCLKHSVWRHADYELEHLMKQRGVWKIRRRIWMKGLKLTGGSYAASKNKKKVHEAP